MQIMIRRFYQSYNALKFSMPMTMLAFIIFIESFIYTNKRNPALRMIMIFTAALLAFIMIMYYHNKNKINKALKKVRNCEAYEKGGCIDRSWFLEERMLISDRKVLAEHPTRGIQKIELQERNHGRYFLHIEQGGDAYDISLRDRESGERAAAFLKRKNPHLQMVNIVPRGSGSLKELGAEA